MSEHTVDKDAGVAMSLSKGHSAESDAACADGSRCPNCTENDVQCSDGCPTCDDWYARVTSPAERRA